MRDIQKEWDLLNDSPEKSPWTKDDFVDRESKLYAILEKNLSLENLRQLATLCGTLPIRAQDRSKFSNAVLAFMVRAFVVSGDRDALVTLLSKRCPTRIVMDNIEYIVVFWGNRLKDPMYPSGEREKSLAAGRLEAGGLGIRERRRRRREPRSGCRASADSSTASSFPGPHADPSRDVSVP